MDEFELIERHFRDLDRVPGTPPAILGIGDDAALVAGDLPLVSAVATLPCDPDASDGDAVARVLVTGCLELLRERGATPAWMTLALTLPRPDPAWLAAFARTLAAAGIPLVGGDTTQGPGSVSLFVHGPAPGEAVSGHPRPTRS